MISTRYSVEPSKQTINISLSSGDANLGLANVILALRECGVIEMPQFLDALERVSARTQWKAEDGQKKNSEHSRQMIKTLNVLSPGDYSKGKQS